MDALEQFFVGGKCTLIGSPRPWDGGGLLPGSFNPTHEGHWRLARVAADIIGQPVAFELSVTNVDKAPLAVEEVQRRVQPFAGRADVWLTRAPRFLDKSALFPGAAFIVGADTAERLLAPRYYEDDGARMLAALGAIAERGCRFLVAGRADATGRFLTLDDLVVPRRFREVFGAIPEHAFRLDVSSTVLRG